MDPRQIVADGYDVIAERYFPHGAATSWVTEYS